MCLKIISFIPQPMQYVFSNQSTKHKGTQWRYQIYFPSLVLDHTKVTSFYSGGGRVATTEYFMAIDAGTLRSRTLVQS